MKSFKNLSKRALALFMALVMSLSLLQVTALATEQEEPRKARLTNVRYPSVERDSVEFTYELSGKPTGVRLIFLWDKTRANPALNSIAEILWDKSSLCGNTITRAVTINYDAEAYRNDNLTGKVDGTLGEGQSNEVNALKKAQEELANCKSDEKPVVFWVPAANLDERSEKFQGEISDALSSLYSAVSEKGGTIITWQQADQASELLQKSTDVDAHSSTAENFSSDVKDALEKIMSDHTEGFTLTFKKTGTTLASKITEVTSNLGEKPEVSEDGSTATVTIPHLYDHQDLYVTVKMALNTGKNANVEEDVLTADVKGERYTGLYDETKSSLPTFPKGTADRRLRAVTFKSTEHGPKTFTPPESPKALPGQLVVLPDVSSQDTPEATFRRWKDETTGRYYAPYQAVVMPDNGMELTAQYGHVEIELHVGDVTPSTTTGNKMAGSDQKVDILNFSNDTRNITAVEFHDEKLSFEFKTPGKRGAGAEVTIKSPASVANNYKTAIFVGATESDNVVAYLVRNESSSGTYTLIISGDGGVVAPENCEGLFSGRQPSSRYSSFYFSKLETVDLTHFDMSGVKSMRRMFYRGDNQGYYDTGSGSNTVNKLTSITWGDSDISSVTDMTEMFFSCSKLKSLDLFNFNTSNVEKMTKTFAGCSGLSELNLSSFDTSKLDDTSGMFSNCGNLEHLDLPATFTAANVINMSAMFSGCSKLQRLDLSHFDTTAGKLDKMNSMFSGCSSLESIEFGETFDTSSVSTMASTFSDCRKLTDDVLQGILEKLKTNNVGYMDAMFYGCYGLRKPDLSGLDTSSATSMVRMFSKCSYNPGNNQEIVGLTELDLRSFDTSKVTKMSEMFKDCSALKSVNVKSESFNTQAVTDMSGMFEGCNKLTSLDLSGFKTGGDPNDPENKPGVENMSRMFSRCSGLTALDLSNFDTSNVSNMSYMFSNCTGLTGLDLHTFNVSRVKDMQYMFAMYKTHPSYSGEAPEANSLQNLNVRWTDNFNGSNRNMNRMFFGCNELTSLDVSTFALKVTSVASMFRSCVKYGENAALTLPANGFDTSGVSNMSDMFRDCGANELDVSSFDTTKVTNMQGMFRGCKVETLDLSNFNTAKVTDMTRMFLSSHKL